MIETTCPPKDNPIAAKLTRGKRKIGRVDRARIFFMPLLYTKHASKTFFSGIIFLNMRLRLILALSVSVLLILGASWTRLVHKPASDNHLVAVEEPVQADNVPIAAAPDTSSSSDISPEPAAAPLSDTDLVTRQLFSDYLSMAYKGQVTPDNVDALASTYANSIANLNRASQLSPVDLNIVPDSKTVLASYNAKLGDIYGKYQTLLGAEFDSSAGLDTANPKLSAFGKRVSTLYKAEAQELTSMPVPQSMLKNHLALVNNYMRNVTDYSSFASASTNPVDTMASISIAQNNLAEENTLITNIQNILSSSSIMKSSQ